MARRWSRLDRSLVSADLINLFPNAYMKYLPRSTSDHAPVLIHLEVVNSSYGFLGFKFQQMWITDASFLECVASAWEDEIKDHSMVRLARKLKHMKYVLRVWNCEVFVNTRRQIIYLEERLSRLEVMLQEGVNDEDEED